MLGTSCDVNGSNEDDLPHGDCEKMLTCYDHICKKRGSNFEPCKVFNKDGVSTCDDGLTCFIKILYGSELPQCKPLSNDGGECLKPYHCADGLLCSLNPKDVSKYQKCVSSLSTQDPTEADATEATTEKPTEKPTEKRMENKLGEEELEEDAVQEVLKEWKERDGHEEEEEQRFRKFKPGERVDTVHSQQAQAVEQHKSPPPLVVVPFSNRGVHPEHPIKTEGNMFQCAKGGKSIPTSHLNDEYCDCDDGEDEPGTSACSVSRERATYYCGWKHNSRSEASDAGLDHMLFPSRVNDGVCDCCDGNDESGSVGSAGSIPPVNACLNMCGSVVLASAARKATFARGNEKRLEYVREGKRMHSQSDKINYGKESGFRKLAEKCWDHRGGNFMYHICPFKTTTQSEIGHGRKRVQISQRYERWKGDKVMVASQGTYCQPIKRGRSTEIHFACGIEDKILSVEEFETCNYKVEMLSPAACF